MLTTLLSDGAVPAGFPASGGVNVATLREAVQ